MRFTGPDGCRCRARRGAARLNGLVLLVGIVLAGLATGAGFYRLVRRHTDEAMAAQMAAVPAGPEERLDFFLRPDSGELAAQIHHRLARFGRFDTEMPWLITHSVPDPSGGAPELWGIECEALPKDLAHREGLKVVIELPPPHALGRAPLAGQRRERVPLRGNLTEAQADARLAEVAMHLLEDLPERLAKLIPGVTFEVRVMRQ